MFLCRRCEKLVERRTEELTESFHRRIQEVVDHTEESIRNLGAGKDANLQALEAIVYDLKARVERLEAER